MAFSLSSSCSLGRFGDLLNSFSSCSHSPAVSTAGVAIEAQLIEVVLARKRLLAFILSFVPRGEVRGLFPTP